MKINTHHKTILEQIKRNAGVPTNHTFLDGYLGNSHPRYPIDAPTLRKIAKAWSTTHRHLQTTEFVGVLDSLVKAPSSTEKMMAGILMDYGTVEQTNFNPKIFDDWLNYLEGWAEIDAVCTGKFTIRSISSQWTAWDQILKRFAKSKNINKRRASLVLLCSPIRYDNAPEMRERAFENILKLCGEKHVLITKAISWLLRSMIRQHKSAVSNFINTNREKLPAIAVRETVTKLKTGRKSTKQ